MRVVVTEGVGMGVCVKSVCWPWTVASSSSCPVKRQEKNAASLLLTQPEEEDSLLACWLAVLEFRDRISSPRPPALITVLHCSISDRMTDRLMDRHNKRRYGLGWTDTDRQTDRPQASTTAGHKSTGRAVELVGAQADWSVGHQSG